jgi:hypothetical protein
VQPGRTTLIKRGRVVVTHTGPDGMTATNQLRTGLVRPHPSRPGYLEGCVMAETTRRKRWAVLRYIPWTAVTVRRHGFPIVVKGSELGESGFLPVFDSEAEAEKAYPGEPRVCVEKLD